MKLLLAFLFTCATLNPVQTNKVYICISSAATKYHDHYCQGLKACKHTIEEVTIAVAQSRGYTPCGYCYK